MSKWWVIFLFLVGCNSKATKFYPMPWKVGQWVTYTVNEEPLKIAVTGQESTFFWLETVESEAIVKVLVTEHDLSNPNRIIVKKLGEPAVEFPLEDFSIKANLSDVKLDEFTEFTTEYLTLLCGKFKAFHIKEGETDIWLSNKIPLFGIVRYKDDDKTIVLRDYGLSGAQSEINEEPEVASIVLE